MNRRVEDAIKFAAWNLLSRLERNCPPDVVVRDGINEPPRKVWVNESVKRFPNWELRLNMQRQLSTELSAPRPVSEVPIWMTVINDDGIWMGVSLNGKNERGSYITHIEPHLWMDLIRESMAVGRHINLTNDLSEPSTLFLRNCIAESNALRKNSPKPSRRLGGFDWLYFDDKKHRQSPPRDTHARDLAWLQRKAPSFFLHDRFGVAVWGHFDTHLVIRHYQSVFLWKIPNDFRKAMIEKAKERDIFVPTRVVPQRADKANKVLHIVDN